MSSARRSALPYMSSSPPGCSLSRLISAATSPRRMVVLLQSARSSVFETTYFGISFMRRVQLGIVAASPVGQNAAQIWYVIAADQERIGAATRSSMLHRSVLLVLDAQGPGVAPVPVLVEAGPSMTPSTVTKDVAISRMRAA